MKWFAPAGFQTISKSKTKTKTHPIKRKRLVLRKPCRITGYNPSPHLF